MPTCTTRIFCVTYYEKSKLLYLRFYGCNLKCIFCINKLSLYDTHLPRYILSILEKFPIRFLKEQDLKTLLRELTRVFDVNIAILGGGEPLLDRSVSRVIKILREYSINIGILTNGFYVKDLVEKTELSNKDFIVVSLKALSRDLYKAITGEYNDIVLSNIAYLIKHVRIPLYIEVVHVPELVDVDEIVRIARWARSLSSSVKLIIDAYVPVPGLRYRRPSQIDVVKICRHLSRMGITYLYRGVETNRYAHGGYVISRGVRIGFSDEVDGNIHLVFPVLKIKDVMSVPVSEKVMKARIADQ